MTEKHIKRRYSPEVRARAVRMVLEHQGEYGSEWAAISAIAPKIGCAAETLRAWLRESPGGLKPEVQAQREESARVRALEQEVRELRQANEILRKASAYFAQAELDRPFKS